MILNDPEASTKQYTLIDYLFRFFIVIDNQAYYQLLKMFEIPIGYLIEIKYGKDNQSKELIDLATFVQFKFLAIAADILKDGIRRGNHLNSDLSLDFWLVLCDFVNKTLCNLREKKELSENIQKYISKVVKYMTKLILKWYTKADMT